VTVHVLIWGDLLKEKSVIKWQGSAIETPWFFGRHHPKKDTNRMETDSGYVSNGVID
jgi:hypothetical protein